MADTGFSLNDPKLTALVADVAAAQARLHTYLADCGRIPGAAQPMTDEWPAFPAHPDLLAVIQAAGRAGRHRDTIGRWCRERGIGRMYGGRWRVSVRRLDALLTQLSE